MTADSSVSPVVGLGDTAVAPAHGAAPAHRPQRIRPRSAPGPRRFSRRAMAVCGADVVSVALACAAVAPAAALPGALVLAAPLALAQCLLHGRRGLYRARLTYSVLAEVPALAGCTLFVWSVAAMLFAAWSRLPVLPWSALVYAVAVQLPALAVARALVRRVRPARRRHATLVVGQGAEARRLLHLLQQRPELGLHPVGIVAAGRIPPPTPGESGESGAMNVPLLRDRGDVLRAVIQNGVRRAVVAHAGGSGAEIGPELLRLFAAQGLRVWAVNTLEGEVLAPAGGLPDHLYGYPAQELCPPPRRSPALSVKRAADVVLSGLALLAAAPVILGCALAVRLSDGPGVLFRQARVGQDERVFTLLKFRTLRPADSTESDTRWNVAGDDRLSPVGNFLRRSSLDELPQLWNVLRGDMSLVGPRPERPYFVEKFRAEFPGYAGRHRMPVGITGLAQVNGLRGDTSIADRARFDNRYIATWSLWQDACILLRTAVSLVRPGGG